MRTGLQLVTTFILNAAWQVALVTALAFVGGWLLRNTSARYRHALWIVALVISVVLPAISTLSGRVAPETSNPLTTAESQVEIAPDDPPAPAPVVAAVESKSAPVIEAQATTQSSPIRVNGRLAAALVALYGGLLLYGCARLLRAWLRTRKLVASAYPVELPQRWQETIALCRRVVGRRAIAFHCSRSITLPITVGSVRPLIVLPESLLRETDPNVLTSALGHEMVHVARWDYLANLLYEFICLPLWFHPAVALIMRRIRQTRELCCDETVATKLLKPEVYARSLLRLIAATPPQNRLAATTIGLTGTDNLEKRIMSLLKPPTNSWIRKSLLVFTAGLLLTIPCIVGAKLALAFEIPAPPTQSTTGQVFEKTPFGEDQLRVREEMKKLEHALQEQVRRTPESDRAEVEKRLLEVQLNLIAHQRLINQYSQQKPAADELRRLRELLAQVETKYPSDQKLLQEARQQLAEAEKLYAESLKSRSTSQNRGPRLISGAEPAYTDDARAKEITGSVLITVTVGRDGTVEDAAIKRSLFPSLDESALRAARKLRFEPALENGEAVTQTITVEFFFSARTSTGNVDQVSEGNWVNADRELRKLKERDALAQDERARRQAELTEGAVISMDRAVQIATSKYPGKVLACSLGRDKDGPVFYHLVIVNNEGGKRTVKYVWVSAIDGTILKSEDQASAPISGGMLNGKAISLPNPEYPPIARQARASGTVNVEIMTDEQGNVISARAISGHPLLQSAAVNAARQAKFTPTYLAGQLVKVRGVLAYNFVID